MFTMKKLALVGVAGLAALSMSCSDTTDEAGGKLTGFSAVDGADVTLRGKITPNEGNSITGIAFTSNGQSLTASWTATVVPSTTEINLDNRIVAGVCAANGNTSGSYKIKISVTFTTGDKLEEDTPSFAVACSGGNSGLNVWSSFELSTAGESYADLDGKQTYKASTATAAQLAIVDIAAFYPAGGCANGYICDTWIISALTGESYITVVPSTLQTTVNGALDGITTAAQVQAFASTYASTLDDWYDEDVDSAVITDGNWFFVDSTEETTFAVKIVSSTASSVTLKAISLF